MSSEFYKPQILECPSCGATLAVPDADTFECDYCGKRIIVPPGLRPPKSTGGPDKPVGAEAGKKLPERQENIQVSADPIALQRRRRRLLILLSISFLVFTIGFLSLTITIIPVSKSISTDQPVEVELRITPLPTLVQFARLTMAFGSEGDQPGQFTDPRSIAVDSQGNIFVADYSTGRINKFDSMGDHLQLIQVQSFNGSQDVYIFNIDIDGGGNLFVAADGNILKYSTLSGELLSTIPRQWPEIYYESVIVAPNGNLYSTNGMAGRDELLILSPQGEILDHWVGVVEKVNHDDPCMQLSLGVNHSGMVYILSPFGNRVYGYNPDGSYNFSFGEQGDRAGQFNLSTGILAVTPKDNLIVGEAYRVDLFDAQGTYLAKTFTIDYQEAGGSMRDMAIDNQGDLYIISSGSKVLKFDMNYP
jgi:DNA-directed RNA polymerase subunit RPC12/RpoP